MQTCRAFRFLIILVNCKTSHTCKSLERLSRTQCYLGSRVGSACFQYLDMIQEILLIHSLEILKSFGLKMYEKFSGCSVDIVLKYLIASVASRRSDSRI